VPDHLRFDAAQKAALDAEARLKNHVLINAKLAATELSKITQAQLEAWRKTQKAKPRAVVQTVAKRDQTAR
jgi:hypothetical protein